MCVAKSDLEVMILLPLLLKHYHYRYVLLSVVLNLGAFARNLECGQSQA